MDFKNTVIIMTSNIGARLITEKKISFGFGETSRDEDNTDIKDKVLGELKGAFRPEFLNRVDDIVVFTKLTRDEIKEIASKMLDNLNRRLEGLNITANFTDAALERLADKGFDPVYGARPLRREIQSSIEDALSEKILDGSVKNGDTVVCDFYDNVYKFKLK